MITNDNTQSVFEHLESQMEDFFDALGQKGEELINEETPVRTGHLKENNRWELLSLDEGHWFNPVDYAVPVELGHTTTSGGHVPANAFFQRGLDRLAQVADELAKEHFFDA